MPWAWNWNCEGCGYGGYGVLEDGPHPAVRKCTNTKCLLGDLPGSHKSRWHGLMYRLRRALEVLGALKPRRTLIAVENAEITKAPEVPA